MLRALSCLCARPRNNFVYGNKQHVACLLRWCKLGFMLRTNKQTNRQTASNVVPTPTDIISEVNDMSLCRRHVGVLIVMINDDGECCGIVVVAATDEDEDEDDR